MTTKLLFVGEKKNNQNKKNPKTVTREPTEIYMRESLPKFLIKCLC